MIAFYNNLRRSPAATVYMVIWLLSAGFLALSGFPQQALFGLFDLLGLGVLGYITFRLTSDPPASPPPANPRARRLLYAQLVLIGLLIVLTGYRGAVFHELLHGNPRLPIFSLLDEGLLRLGSDWMGNGYFLTNPVLYFVVPFFGLLLLGARPLELGFGPGHRVWLVTFLWSVLPLMVIVLSVILGQVTVSLAVQRIVSNSLQNGFFEEFLFRGALQTRLRRLVTPGWAVVVQALIFGLWHLGLGHSATGDGALLPAVLSIITIQSVLGLGFGLIFERTRNLIAPSIVHVLLNSMGL